MVSGIRLFSVTHCAGHSKPQTIFQKQAIDIFVDRNSLHGCPHADVAVHSTPRPFWLYAAVLFIPPAYRDHCDGLHHFSGNREEDVLQAGEMLKWHLCNSAQTPARLWEIVSSH